MLAMLGIFDACAWLRSRFAPLTQNHGLSLYGISKRGSDGQALKPATGLQLKHRALLHPCRQS